MGKPNHALFSLNQNPALIDSTPIDTNVIAVQCCLKPSNQPGALTGIRKGIQHEDWPPVSRKPLPCYGKLAIWRLWALALPSRMTFRAIIMMPTNISKAIGIQAAVALISSRYTNVKDSPTK